MEDLSNIREAGVADESEAESHQFGGTVLSKRQKVSNDDREQAQRDKLLKMFTPFLEEKMAEQTKSNEQMMERFKNSMMEAMHEQQNLYLSSLKKVIPKTMPPAQIIQQVV